MNNNERDLLINIVGGIATVIILYIVVTPSNIVKKKFCAWLKRRKYASIFGQHNQQVFIYKGIVSDIFVADIAKPSYEPESIQFVVQPFESLGTRLHAIDNATCSLDERIVLKMSDLYQKALEKWEYE